jgi:hypothetical protein
MQRENERPNSPSVEAHDTTAIKLATHTIHTKEDLPSTQWTEDWIPVSLRLNFSVLPTFVGKRRQVYRLLFSDFRCQLGTEKYRSFQTNSVGSAFVVNLIHLFII